MEGYEEKLLAGLTAGKVKMIKPRKVPNLPSEITGKGAFWFQPGPDGLGNELPPSYHVQHEDQLYPIEFINRQWYRLEWDASPKFKGYWTKVESGIPEGDYQLGWLGNTLEAKTPTITTQYRDRAESSSTQPEKEASSPEKEDKNPMDINPARTELLAQEFADNPIFSDIAEAIEGPQDRTHYLPTTVPIAPCKQGPVGINPTPLKIRATTPGETLGATTDTTKLVTNAIKLDGSLKGKVPETFDGDRTKTQEFINSFALFFMTNEENSHMKNPYKRCTYFLGLFSGEKVDDWVEDQTEILQNKTSRNSDPISKTDETLWTDLLAAFHGAFAHTGKVEEARTNLDKLEMEGDLIDEYIAKFENLLKRAEIPRTEVGSIKKFKDGLRKGVLSAILKRDTWPVTIDDWEENARCEVRRFGIIKESLGDRGNNYTSTKQARWRTLAQQFKANKTPYRKKDEAVPMDIDAAIVPGKDPRKITESERLKKEGRCYKCQQQGHLKRNCPEWPKKADKPPPYPFKGRSITLNTIDEEGQGSKDLKELARAMMTLDIKEQDELFNNLMYGNEDF